MNILRTPFGHAYRVEPPEPRPEDVRFYLDQHELSLRHLGVREAHIFLTTTGRSSWDREWVAVYE